MTGHRKAAGRAYNFMGYRIPSRSTGPHPPRGNSTSVGPEPRRSFSQLRFPRKPGCALLRHSDEIRNRAQNAVVTTTSEFPTDTGKA